MVSLIQTTIATVLGPLVAELAASRQQTERQAEQLVSQAETIGMLRGERNSAAAAAERLAGQITRQVETIGELQSDAAYATG